MWVEKHGKTFRIRDRRGNQVVTVESGYATKTVAKNAMANLRSAQLRGVDLVPRGSHATLNEWIDLWQPGWEGTLKSTSVYSEVGRIRNHIRALLGDHELGEIDGLAVQGWVAALVKGKGPMADPKHNRRPLSPKTVRNCHGLLHTILQAAVVNRLIAVNPCAETNLPERIHREMRFLTEPEFERMLTAMPAHWRPLVLLLGSTGLRWGEAIGLKVGRVDLLAKPPRLRVEEQLQELSGTAEFEFTAPKTRRARRTVTFTAKVADALIPLVMDKDRNDPVFTAPRGGFVRTRHFRRTWLRARKAAGLDDLRIHDLRHTHAAWLISANSPLTAIQHRLGHSSIAVTSDLYGHLLPGVDAGILDVIEGALSGVDLATMDSEIADELADVLGEL